MKTIAVEHETKDQRKNRRYRERVRKHICAKCGEKPAWEIKPGKILKNCKECHALESQRQKDSKIKRAQVSVAPPIKQEAQEEQPQETKPEIKLASTAKEALDDWLDASVAGASYEELKMKREHYERLSRA